MSNMVSAGEGREFPKPTIGLVQAVCYAVWNIGPQVVKYQGTEKVQNKTILAWEINEFIRGGDYDGKRFVVSKKFTASLGDKANLRKDLEQWRGKNFTPDELKGFDLDSLIGVNCMLNLVSNESTNGKTYINVGSITPLMKGLSKMEPENPVNPPPKWVQKLIDQQVDPTEYHTVKDEPSDAAEPAKEEEVEIPF